MKILVIAEIPDDKAQMFFQHIRDFDVAHPGCKFQAIANAPDRSIEELKEMLDIQPPLQQKGVIKS